MARPDFTPEQIAELNAIFGTNKTVKKRQLATTGEKTAPAAESVVPPVPSEPYVPEFVGTGDTDRHVPFRLPDTGWHNTDDALLNTLEGEDLQASGYSREETLQALTRQLMTPQVNRLATLPDKNYKAPEIDPTRFYDQPQPVITPSGAVLTREDAEVDALRKWRQEPDNAEAIFRMATGKTRAQYEKELKDELRKKAEAIRQRAEKRIGEREKELVDKMGGGILGAQIYGMPTMVKGGRDADLVVLTKRLLGELDDKTSKDKQEGDERSGLFTGIGNALTIEDILSAGYSSIFEGMTTNEALEKAAKGEPLDDTERDIIDLLKLKNRVQEYIDLRGGKTTGATVGRGVGESLPFMAQFGLTSGVGSTAAKLAGKTLFKTAAKNAAGKALRKGVGYTASSLAMLPLQAGTYNNYSDRTTDQYRIGEDGSVAVFPTSRLSRMYKAAADSFTDVFTEHMGDALGAGVRWLVQKPVHSVAKATGKKFASDMLLGGYRGDKYLADFRRRVLWDGPVNEWLEEVAGGIMSPLLTGETERWKENLSAENLWTTFLTTSVMGAGFTALEAPQAAMHGRRLLSLRNAEKKALSQIENPQLKEQVFAAMREPTIEQRSKAMAGIDWRAEGVTQMDAAHAADYVRYKTERQMMGGILQEGQQAAAFRDIHQGVATYQYQGADGQTPDGSLVVSEGADGTIYAVLAGDLNGEAADNTVFVMDVETGERKQVARESLTNLERMSITDYLADQYASLEREQEFMQAEIDRSEDMETGTEAGIIPERVAEIVGAAAAETVADQQNVPTSESPEESQQAGSTPEELPAQENADINSTAEVVGTTDLPGDTAPAQQDISYTTGDRIILHDGDRATITGQMPGGYIVEKENGTFQAVRYGDIVGGVSDSESAPEDKTADTRNEVQEDGAPNQETAGGIIAEKQSKEAKQEEDQTEQESAQPSVEEPQVPVTETVADITPKQESTDSEKDKIEEYFSEAITNEWKHYYQRAVQSFGDPVFSILDNPLIKQGFVRDVLRLAKKDVKAAQKLVADVNEAGMKYGGKPVLTPRHSIHRELEQMMTEQASRTKKQDEAIKTNDASLLSPVQKIKHTKTGADMYRVQLQARIEHEAFNVLRQRAKSIGGYYSSFSRTRGFLFPTEEQAELFRNETETSRTPDTEVSEPKPAIVPKPHDITAEYGAENKLVTTKQYEELKRRMREKLGQLNAGFDPEILSIGAQMAAYHIEAGARKFADFARRMTDELGEAIQPYLKAIYISARHLPGMESLSEYMDSYQEVMAYDIDTLNHSENKRDNEQTEANTETIIRQAETVSAEAATIADSEPGEVQRKEAAKVLEKIDDSLSEIDNQIALLGNYDRTGETAKDFTEYGNKRAEKNFKKDLVRFSKALAQELGWQHDTDKRGNPVYADTNIPPAGGEGTFIQWMPETEYGVYVSVSVSPSDYIAGQGYTDDFKIETRPYGDILWRITTKADKYRGFKNQYAPADITAQQLAALVQKEIKSYIRVDNGEQTVAGSSPKPSSDEKSSKQKDSPTDRERHGTDSSVVHGRLSSGITDRNGGNETGSLIEGHRRTGELRDAEGTDNAGEGNRPRRGEGDSQRAVETELAAGRPGTDLRNGRDDAGDHRHPDRNSQNYEIVRGQDVAPRGDVAKIRANLDAIRLVKELEQEGRPATTAEQTRLVQYTGWGGLASVFKQEHTYYQQVKEALTEQEYEAARASTMTSFYTPPAVVASAWDIAVKLGFDGGDVLEPSAGIGHFFGLMPPHLRHRSSLTGVEIDPISGRILKALYPGADVRIEGYEQQRIRNNSLDLVITNVPFGRIKVYDPYEKDLSKAFDIHDYFIAKSIRKLKPGGLGIFISSTSTLDTSKKLREWVTGDGNSDFIGAVRLNHGTFKNTAGTETSADLIVIRKRDENGTPDYAVNMQDVSMVRRTTYPRTKINSRGEVVNEDIPARMIINRYFQEHPEHLGGVMKFGFEDGKEIHPTEQRCSPVPEIDQQKVIADFIAGLPSDIYETPAQKAEVAPVPLSPDGTKEGGLTLINGRPCLIQYGQAVEVDWNTNKVAGHSKIEALKDYLSIKEAINTLLEAENGNTPQIEELRRQLNSVYNRFVSRYGTLSENKRINFLRDDVDFPSVAAIETVTKKQKPGTSRYEITVTKSDIFNRRVIDPAPKLQAETVEDGIKVSLYHSGKLDIPYISELIGRPETDIRNEILERRLAFIDPQTGLLVERSEYLSGNVRRKLALAEQSNEAKEYDANIDELRKVVPRDLPLHLLKISLGSTWIPAEAYERFFEEKFEVKAKITRENNGKYTAVLKATNNSADINMGMPEAPGSTLALNAMNNTQTTIYTSEYDPITRKSKRVKDPSATAQAAAKQTELDLLFEQWCKAEGNPFAEEMVENYNDQFNGIIDKKIDVSGFDYFPGASHVKKPHKHQKEGTIRALNGATLLAHEVGTGKTITLISTAMEMRRLGIARKPCIVVQRATYEQFVGEIKSLYPAAKVLVPSAKDLTQSQRQQLFAKIAYNDWDIVVLYHGYLDSIPDDPDRVNAYIDAVIQEKLELLDSIEANNPKGGNYMASNIRREVEMLEDSRIDENGLTLKKKKKIKDIEKKKANVDARTRRLLDRRTDKTLTFEKLGIDALLVDEAHTYKKLGFSTSLQNIKGIDPTASQKAQSMRLKSSFILNNNDGKNVVFATGTPISNTMAEMWTFMRYLLPESELAAYDLKYFDSFVNNFGSIEESAEFNASGKFKVTNRFASYSNVPELLSIWKKIAHTVLTEEVADLREGVGTPLLEGGKPTDMLLEQTAPLKGVMKGIRATLERYDKMKGREKRENSHIPLVMFGLAKRAAIDVRLIDSALPDDPNSKLNVAVSEIVQDLTQTESYKGTVAVFCDSYQSRDRRFNVFTDMKNKLIASGVPASQIAIINDYNTDEKRKELFTNVNKGDVRVVMGTTEKLGVGVNMQERLHMLVHMDVPIRPMDYQQRNGRILRQGNIHLDMKKPVRILRLGVKQTLDVTGYQRLQIKEKFIQQIMKGDMSVRMIEEDAEGSDVNNFSQMMAELSGSQAALALSVEQNKLRKLLNALEYHKQNQIYIASEVRRNNNIIATTSQIIDELKAQQEQIRAVFPDSSIVSLKIGNREANDPNDIHRLVNETYTKRIEAEVEKLRKNAGLESSEMKGSITVNGRKFSIRVIMEKEYIFSLENKFRIIKTFQYQCEDFPDLKGEVAASLDNVLAKIGQYIDTSRFDKIIADRQSGVERARRDNEVFKPQLGKPFPKQAELESAQERVETLQQQMAAELAEIEAKEEDSQVEAIDMDAELDAAEETDADGVRYRDGDWEDTERAEIIARAKEDETYLKAPNGEDTNLSPEQWVTVRTTAFKDWFGDWEDWTKESSEVIDENGEPLVVYHGTNDDFTVFDSTKEKYHHSDAGKKVSFFTPDPKLAGRYGRNVMAVFLNIRKPYIVNYRGASWQGLDENERSQKDADGNSLWRVDTWSDVFGEDIAPLEILKGVDYADGIILLNVRDPWKTDLYLVRNDAAKQYYRDYFADFGRELSDYIVSRSNLLFDSQIKSATDNFGTFDKNQSDIRYREHAKSKMRKNAQQIEDAVLRLADALHTSVHIVRGEKQVADTETERRRRQTAGGWYDPRTGQVYIVPANLASLAEAEATVLHEVVGHKGLRNVLGKRFGEFLDKTYNGLDGQARRRADEYAANEEKARPGLSENRAKRIGTEEYLARLAEGNITPGRFARIIGRVRRILREVLGIPLRIDDRDIAYMLWLSRHRLSQAKTAGDAVHQASDRRRVRRILYGEGVRFREDLNDKMPAPEDYDFAGDYLKSVMQYKKREATRVMLSDIPPTIIYDKHNLKRRAQLHLLDSTLPVRLLQEEITRRGGRIDDITDVHKHLNQFTSVAKVAIDKYTKDYIDPLLDNIANIARNTGLSEDNIIDYITAQSSLERENSGIQAFSRDEKEPWRKGVAMNFVKDFQQAMYVDRIAILQEQGSKALSETEKRILPKGLAEKLDSEGYAGLSDIEQAVLQDSPLNALWHSINAANDRILDILVEDSMITRETKERIKGHNWEYYVPLTGWDYNFKREDGSPYIYNPLEIYDFISPVSRFHINQVVKEATGRGKKPFNPIASMINIGIGAIITSKQNKAMQSVLRLARNNPHPDLYRINRVWLMKGPSGEWYETTIEPTFEQVENSKAARKELASLEMQMSLALMSGDETQADSIMQKMVLVDALNTVKPADSLRSNFGMEAPVGQREQMQRYVECYINGVKHIVTFADPAVANAINTYNRLTIPRWVDNSIGDATRWLASAFTSRNPAFVSVNFLRDLQHAGLVHLLNHEGTLKDFALNVAPGMKAIIRNVRGKARPLTLAELKKRNILDYRQWGELASEFGSDRVWDTLYDYFRESGGETGFVHSKEVMQVEREIRRYVAIRTRRVKELMQVSDAREKANIALSYVGDRLGARKVARMFDNASKVAENTSRFATFVTSLAHNRTLLQAVDDAKNITVNFNRRGSASRGLGMFYVFFNASVQGAAQVGRIAWANKKRFKQMVAAMMAGGFLDAMLVDLFLGGQGDENEYYLSEWERSNHIIIPYIGRRGYIKIPLPQGFCAFHGIGVLFHDLCKGKINVEECSRSILSLLYENFSPVASPSSKGDLTRVVVPTALTPFYDVAVNEDAFGYPVGRRKYGQREYPLSEMGLKNVNKGIYYVCRGLNALGGGDEDTPAGMRKDGRIDPLLRGIFEWNPSHVEHVLTYYGGGIGKFSRDVVHTTQAIMDSETELSSHDLPIINRLFGIARKKSPAGEYFELRAKMENLAGVYRDKGYNGMNAEQVKLYRKYSAGISRLYKILGETHPGTPEYDKVREELDATMREYLKLNERYDTGN